MFTSIWTTIQDIGVFKSICTLAVAAFFAYLFVGGKGGKGGNSGGGSTSTPPAQG